MLDIKCLHGDIHRTYNMHDALYNSRVMEKSLEMLSNRYLRYSYVLSLFHFLIKITLNL